MSDSHLPVLCELPGFHAHPGTLQQYLALTADSIDGGIQRRVVYLNLHSLYLYLTQPALRASFEGTTVMVDGMPLIGLLRLFGHQVARAHRVTWVDFIGPLMEQARDRQWRVFHVGQSLDVQHRALRTLRDRYPGLQLDGADGYFDLDPNSQDTRALVERITAYQPRILLLGLGTPIQEHWMAASQNGLDVPIVFCCGACMEYVAGAVKTPPRWMGRFGLEWSFRLLENPARFAYRYLVEPILLIGLLGRAWWRHRSRPAPLDS